MFEFLKYKKLKAENKLLKEALVNAGEETRWSGEVDMKDYSHLLYMCQRCDVATLPTLKSYPLKGYHSPLLDTSNFFGFDVEV